MSDGGGRLEGYCLHITEAIGRIFSYLEGVPRETFLTDTLLQHAVIRNLEIVGEASRNILRYVLREAPSATAAKRL